MRGASAFIGMMDLDGIFPLDTRDHLTDEVNAQYI